MASMDEDQIKHFRGLCASLLACYVDTSSRNALVVIGKIDDTDVPGVADLAELISVGCSDITAIQLLSSAQGKLGHIVMNDAPPRELFS